MVHLKVFAHFEKRNYIFRKFPTFKSTKRYFPFTLLVSFEAHITARKHSASLLKGNVSSEYKMYKFQRSIIYLHQKVSIFLLL